jgi:DNA-binding transcriptional MerR regulator
MGTRLLISELAERTGFSPSTLRYYEQVGLLTPDGRTPAGYRLYDEKAPARLKFIARGKQLGLPLDQIRDLVAIWDGGRCAHVQERLRAHIATKSAEVECRIEELSHFADELASAEVELSRLAPEGACSHDCGCTPETSVPQLPRLPQLTPTMRPAKRDTEDSSTTHSDPPIACSLGAVDQPVRRAEWYDILTAVTRRDVIAGGVALSLPSDAVIASRVADLAVREQACCAFFDFTLRIIDGSLILEVRAPESAADSVASLFGPSR